MYAKVTRRCFYVCALLMVLFLSFAPQSANAQLNGFNLKGDFGLASGSQAPPGAYYGFLYYRYGTDRINNQDGKQVNPGGVISPLI